MTVVNNVLLEKFIEEYSPRLLKYNSFDVNIHALDKYTNNNICLTGNYVNGYDINHGDTITFTYIVSGYQLEIKLWQWDVDTLSNVIIAVDGKVSVNLSDLETMLLLFKMAQERKSIIRSIVVLIILIIISALLLPIISTFKALLGWYRLLILGLIALAIVISIATLVYHQRAIKSISPWLKNNKLLK